MALAPALLVAATLLFFQAHAAAAAAAAAAATTKPTAPATAAAPAPEAEPLNITKILEKASQFTTFLRLLKETQIGEQIENQLNNSYGGMTIFAPTDNAFDSLKPGTLNKLNSQQQAALILYHVLPRYYSKATFQTISNPISTQATGNHGTYVVNATSGSNQLNISTGVNHVTISDSLYSTFPLAIYDINSVLLPYDLFGPKPPPSPPPKPSHKVRAKAPSSSDDGASVEADSTSPSAAPASINGRRAWWASVGGVGLVVSVGAILI